MNTMLPAKLTSAGAAFLISEYYTRKEASLRFALFYTFGVLGPAISGVCHSCYFFRPTY